MKVAVVGATGVVGGAATRALVQSGHDVFGLARTPDRGQLLESWGATAVPADLFDHTSLVTMFEGCDVVVNAATRIPVNRVGRPSSWRENDRLHTQGVRAVTTAARDARVRRVVHQSSSLVYADQGDHWIDEHSPLDINCATEPMCVAESHVQTYASDLRQGVVLRLGTLIGDDARTRSALRTVLRGGAVGLGTPEGWVHPLHTDDIGPAVVAALTVAGGVYNVGAEPVRRRDLVQGFAEAAGRTTGRFAGSVQQRLTGRRAEPLTRSHRVSSEHFRAQTGWTPRRERFGASWLTTADVGTRVAR